MKGDSIRSPKPLVVEFARMREGIHEPEELMLIAEFKLFASGSCEQTDRKSGDGLLKT